MKRSVLILCAAAVLASCASSDLQEQVIPTDGVDIVLQSSHIDAITRAPYVGEISEENPLSARVLAAKEKGRYLDEIHADGTMEFKGTTTGYMAGNVTGNPKYPDGSSIFLCGLVPNVSTWNIANDVATISFKGNDDVMVATEIESSQALVTTPGGAIPSLTFKHLLTKLEISLEAKAPAAPSAWGKVKKIELVSIDGDPLKNTVEVSLVGTTAPVFTTGGDVPVFYGMSTTGDKANYSNELFTKTPQAIHSTEARKVAYAMIAPFIASKGTKQLAFEITTETTPVGQPADVSVNLNFDGSTSGRAFGITFVFTAEADLIVGEATVIDWATGTDVKEEVK